MHMNERTDEDLLSGSIERISILIGTLTVELIVVFELEKRAGIILIDLTRMSPAGTCE